MNHFANFTSALRIALVVAGLLFVLPMSEAWAQTSNDTMQCTNFKQRALQTLIPNPLESVKPGMLGEIYNFIKSTMNQATEKLFKAFTSSVAYQRAVGAAMTLMVLFYAVGFTIGVVQPSFQQVLIRLVKIGVVGAIISPTGWTFFSENVVNFFQDGTDQLVNGVQAIGFGISAPAGSSPFYALDRVASFIIQPDTIIAVMGSIGAGGPFGLSVGGLMLMAVFGFFRLILRALEIYATTFVARSLVLGLAPIFFVFLMFDKTKSMFIQWVNALLNLSLQPVIMFTFLSFFLVMIETSAQSMLNAELCWHDFKNVDGSVNKMAFWRFKDPLRGVSTGEYGWNGSLECILSPTGSGDPNNKCPEFPINILDILSFLILVYIATRFADVTKNIAGELSNAMVNLDNQGKLDQLMSNKNERAGASLSGANKKAGG